MNRRPMGWGVAFLFTAIFASSVFASPSGVGQSGWQRKPNPYSDLFQPAPLVKPGERTQATPPSTEKPKMVCGMTVIPADPSIDPRFKFMIPAPDRPTKFTIRAIDPAICNPVAR
jgi:hypothetical protein